MVNAMINISDRANRVLNIVKEMGEVSLSS